MIGIIVVTHHNLGAALLDTAEFILGTRPESLTSVSINVNENPDQLRDKIVNAIRSLKKSNGILILTDMFGGTPSNLSYSLLEAGCVEVLSGVNLAILLKAINSRGKMELVALAECLENHGKRSVSLASGILKGSKSN